MLHNQEALTHAQSNDFDPSTTAEDKVESIRYVLEDGDLCLHPPYLQGDSWTGYYVLQPGFGAIAKFQLDRPAIDERQGVPEATMHLTQFDLGDEALYGQGLGTGLLQRAVRVGYEKATELDLEKPKLTTFETDRTNLIKLNTIIKVLGKSNVSAWMRGEHYGAGSDRPLEQILIDHPYEEGPGNWYLLQKVCAHVDPDILFAAQPSSH